MKTCWHNVGRFQTLSFFKIGSMIQKLFDVEKLQIRYYRHKNNVKNGAYAIFSILNNF